MPSYESIKIVLGVIATTIGILSYIPYYRDIFKGKTKPHAFSWLIWGALMTIAYAGQIAENAGPGSWVTGFSALACLSISAIAFVKGERQITKSDWYCLIFAAAAIPLWAYTKTPLWSMVLITIIDTVGFYPTFRKSYYKPFEETAITYIIAVIKFVIALIALDTFSVVTVLYPLSLVVMNGAFLVMLYARRKVVAAQI